MDIQKIVKENEILELLKKKKKNSTKCSEIEEILLKAKKKALIQNESQESEYVQGLDLEDVATLLSIDASNAPLMRRLFETALEIKQSIYGNRIVLFAPLYISNWCSGSCLYCGFRSSNRTVQRKILEKQEIVEEVKTLQGQGHKRILMLCGDHPKYPFDRFLEDLEIVSSIKTQPHGEIRRINVEIPSLDDEQFKKLKESDKIGTYTLFQETYHKKTFEKMHPRGPKSDYLWRLETMNRAQRNGIDDVGIGVLFGLYDYRFETLALLMHAQYLYKNFGTGPHTISIPRIQAAPHTPCSIAPPYPVDDINFKKIVAILRCAVPYTGIILSTRENPSIRKDLYSLGVSQISAGSKTEPGGYNQTNQQGIQFSLNDNRSAEEVIYELIELGYIPSWCTACYRLGRTGKKFMDLAKCGRIQNFCQPNALLTLSEYLMDYANEKTQKIGWNLIESETKKIPSKIKKQAFLRKMEEIKNHVRDLYF